MPETGFEGFWFLVFSSILLTFALGLLCVCFAFAFVDKHFRG